MPRLQKRIVKHTEFALVIVAACALSIGIVMGPKLLEALQEPAVTSLERPPDRVSSAATLRSVEPETLELPVIPAKRVLKVTPPPRVASKVMPLQSRVSSLPSAPGFLRVLYSVASGTRMHGEDVRRLQIRLMILANVNPREGGDGWFGPRTADGLRKFQRANGLPANGVADRRTWDVLFSSQARGFKF